MGIIGVEHSPSCAIEVFQSEGTKKVIRSNGIFIKELLKELSSNGLNHIPIIETSLDKSRIKSTCKELEKVMTQLEL